MTMFDYAQSNSLLKQAVEEKNDSDSTARGMMPSKDGALPSLRLESLDSAESNLGTMPMNALAESTSKTREKIIPTKKSQHNKHKLASGSTTKAAPASQQWGPQSGTQTQSSAKEDSGSKPKKIRVRKPRRAIPNEKEYIPENEQPTQTDVVGGRGGRSNHHPGNRPYWIRILESRQEYTRSRSDHEKARIANGILRYVQEELKGRFLNIDSKTKRWYILPDTVVLDKIKQALRDKYIPYWARELQIESKTHGAANAPTNKTAANGVFDQLLNHNKASGISRMAALRSSFGGQNYNHNLVNQAVQLAAIKASRQAHAAGNPFGFPGAPKLDAQVGNPTASNNNSNNNNANNQSGNKLGFLFGASAAARRPPTAAIPTVDDILKCKIDQMPSFGGIGGNPGLMAAAMASVGGPQLPSIGTGPFQSALPPTLMNSLGLGGLPGPNALLNDHRGFGAGGNPGAPALPPTAGPYGMGASMPPSLGVLQTLNMKSLDKYVEEKIAGGQSLAFGSNAATLPSLNLMNALAGTSFDTSSTHASSGSSLPPVPAQAPAGAKGGSKKTDWNAMYARALSKK